MITERDYDARPQNKTRSQLRHEPAPEMELEHERARHSIRERLEKPRQSVSSDTPPETDAADDVPPREMNDRNTDSGSVPPAKSKLRFSEQEIQGDESTESTAIGKRQAKADKLHDQAEKSATKLQKAREKLPKKRHPAIKREFDADTGKARRRLHFEEEVKTKRQHLKGSAPTRPLKAGASVVHIRLHGKIHEVERENVGVEAAHRGEILVEHAARNLYRHHKTAPYRRVAKLEQKTSKLNMNAAYQQALADNPALEKNAVARAFQKHKIKRDHAKAVREAQRAASTAKKTAVTTEKLAARAAAFVNRHPVAFGILGALLFLIFFLSTALSSCSNMSLGSLSSVLASSYLAEDADIDDAELSYTEWETDLQLAVLSAESTYPGYDEYRYSVDNIEHNPYELMAYLTAMYQDFRYSEVEAVLQQVFQAQYSLNFTPEVEIRYREETFTDTWTDPDTGETYSDTYTEMVPYEWHILNVTLTARSFTDVILPRIDSNQLEIYNLLMVSKGNRQYVRNPFDFNWLPRVSSYYGYRVHPISGVKNYHKGIDIAVLTGTEIHAGFDGVVTAAAYDAGGFGWYVSVTDSNGLIANYAHCDALLVSEGQPVAVGDVIALSGNTGNSTGPHLHLEVIKDGRYLNPIYFAETGDDGSGYIPPGSSGGYIIPDYPGEPMTDANYAAMMEEAQKYLGYPYVWGGSTPTTSFDCSGFVCWVINQSGVGSVGRTTAQGLFNLSTPVSRENAQPGDLIFFHSTYSTTDTVTHVGIYVGNDMMIHAGNPISYVNYITRYGDHFYAFGRIN